MVRWQLNRPDQDSVWTEAKILQEARQRLTAVLWPWLRSGRDVGIIFPSPMLWASQVVLVVKNPPANAGDMRVVGLISGLGRSPGGGHGNPLQYSCLENPMDRGDWWATAHSVPKSQARLERLSMHTPMPYNHSLQSSSPCLGVCSSCQLFSAECTHPASPNLQFNQLPVVLLN